MNIDDPNNELDSKALSEAIQAYNKVETLPGNYEETIAITIKAYLYTIEAKDPSAFFKKYGHTPRSIKEQLADREQQHALYYWIATLRRTAEIADTLKVIPHVKDRAEWADNNRRVFLKARTSLRRLCDSLDVTPGFFHDLDDFDITPS